MKRLLIGLGVAAIAATAWAQITLGPFLGTELFNITLGSGSGAQITMAQVRNATAITVTNVTTGTVAAVVTQNRIVFGTALTGTVTVNTPLAPYDGEMMEIVNGTNAAFTFTITFAPSPGQSLLPAASGALATLAAGASGEFQYSSVTATWYRIR